MILFNKQDFSSNEGLLLQLDKNYFEIKSLYVCIVIREIYCKGF